MVKDSFRSHSLNRGLATFDWRKLDGQKVKKRNMLPLLWQTPWPAFLFSPARPDFSPTPIAKHISFYDVNVLMLHLCRLANKI